MQANYKVKVSFVVSDKFKNLHDRLGKLQGKPLERLIARAMAATIIKGLINRFLAGLPEALETVPLGGSARATRPHRDRKKALAEAMTDLSVARADGVKSKVDLAKRRVQLAEKRYIKALDPKKTKHKDFATLVGEAMKVLQEMIKTSPLGGGLNEAGVGAGNRKALESIKTNKGPTKSRMNTLWRHLEYGTGIYAADPSVNANSPFKVPGGQGEWFFGGVVIAGSAPIRALDGMDGSELVAEISRLVQETLTA